MYIISLYLVLHTYAATFDIMCVKKTELTKRGLRKKKYIERGPKQDTNHILTIVHRELPVLKCGKDVQLKKGKL
jgi:hypothetical protein